MKYIILAVLFSICMFADDVKRQREVLLCLAGSWSGGGENVNISSDNKKFPSKAVQKTSGKLIFNDKALFRRAHFKRIIPEREDQVYDSFIISFWLDFKQVYRSITFDSKGRVYYKDFTVDDHGNSKVYSKIDNKFILTGKSKVTADKFKGSSEYESGGFIRKSTWSFDRVKNISFDDPEANIDPEVKKVLDSFSGNYPLPGHFKLHEEKEVLSVLGYDTKQKVFMKWEIHSDGNYKVFEGKDFLKGEEGYWKQVE